MVEKLPPAFVVRMRVRLGAEFSAFLEVLQAPPATTIRLHPLKGAFLFSESLRVPWCEWGRILPERPAFEEEPFWHAGAYYVQEASGMSLEVFLPKKRPLRIIDLSAAPGGKSTLILGALGMEGGLLIANDPHPVRRQALKENLERWGMPSYFITGRHPAYWAQRYPEQFDVVVLDAPCSGEGLWRKNPAACSQWNPALPRRMQRMQRALLYAALRLVTPGGRLIYSTCTFAPEENEENLAAVLPNQGWQPIRWESPPPEVRVVTYEGGGEGYYFYPHLGPGEGFFISAWERPATSFRRTIGQLPRASPPYRLPEGILAVRHKETLYALTECAHHLLPPNWENEVSEGLPLLHYSRPAHAAALMIGGMSRAFPQRELQPDEFIAYLRGQAFSPKDSIEWVTYQGLGVGWLYKGQPSLPLIWRRFRRS
ncbi:MAG: RsmB/NOP family class I SAM-dependent RNA methyltransferase [Bacteroidia bacterium]|nr:RsmB/NOP family class I SAM-dependent RNA methyltransferase [Bacteroidia bacterium]MDW8235374.1 RsmB/NOP family class I SAM-dependent RNA methyltransferase [Bacteroidia bacterium]